MRRKQRCARLAHGFQRNFRPVEILAGHQLLNQGLKASFQVFRPLCQGQSLNYRPESPPVLTVLDRDVYVYLGRRHGLGRAKSESIVDKISYITGLFEAWFI